MSRLNDLYGLMGWTTCQPERRRDAGVCGGKGLCNRLSQGVNIPGYFCTVDFRSIFPEPGPILPRFPRPATLDCPGKKLSFCRSIFNVPQNAKKCTCKGPWMLFATLCSVSPRTQLFPRRPCTYEPLYELYESSQSSTRVYSCPNPKYSI